VLIAGLSGALLLVHIAGLLGGAMFCCYFDFLAFVFPAFAFPCAFCFSVECLDPVVQFDKKAKGTQWRVPQVGWSHNADMQIKSFINLVAKELKIVRVY